jgi:catechol 2,3-dioxygenase-like lactoylglutathione lyase family enzyme
VGAETVIVLSHLDHFVMPCKNVEAIADFYVQALDMRREVFGDGRLALHFGSQKINLQPAGGFEGLRAMNHLSGTQDFCLIAETPVADVKKLLEDRGIEVIEGPITRTGASGPITSIYLRDPEENLVEIANYG